VLAVGVADPIFTSLWDATFNEVQNGTPVWEVYLDTPNFFADEPPAARAAAAEGVMRRLRSEGWVTFVRRRWETAPHAPGVVLSDEEVDELLACARGWYEELTEATPLPDRLMPTTN
jgi:hypothetical protein